MRELLFICTGNYYRSRFAEAYFNHFATERALPWRAFSRGLGIHYVTENLPISDSARLELIRRGIDLRHTGPDKVALALPDFERAARWIALKRDEHEAMMREQFPDWVDRVEYWAVHDLDVWQPEQALPTIAAQVDALLEELADEALAAGKTE